ncbi:MAG: SLC13 family permease [Candidatus Saganbacteria bacterium]|nr:SLC13 family permease [Candidatus Saganbacteria bacterium]
MEKILALTIFIIAYLCFIFFTDKKAYFAVAGAILLIIFGVISHTEAFSLVNWNVMGIFVGVLIIAEFFIFSKAPEYFAEKIVNVSPTTTFAILAICTLSGFISAFVENIATVMIMAPIALAIAHKLKTSPIPMIIGLTLFSNLQGTSTLIGDPPSMILAGYTKMNFLDFFFFLGRPSIFFAVQIGALAALVILYFYFRTLKEPPPETTVTKVTSWLPTFLLVTLILALALSSFSDQNFSYLAGSLCLLFALLGFIWYGFCPNREEKLHIIAKKFDWDTTFFLIGSFIIIGSLTLTGWITLFGDYLATITTGNLLGAYILIIVISVLVSAVVDNVPYLLTMIPVVQVMADKGGFPLYALLFGLLIGTCLGGNITPIGASANVAAVGFLKKQHHSVSFGEFMKMSIPFTIAAVVASSIFVWVVWAR